MKKNSSEYNSTTTPRDAPFLKVMGHNKQTKTLVKESITINQEEIRYFKRDQVCRQLRVESVRKCCKCMRKFSKFLKFAN